jgi:hypothetical protein
MLKILRKHTKSVIWTVVASFVLFGAFSFGASFDKKSRYAGEAFDKGVSFQEFNRFYKSAQIFAYGQKDSPEAQDPDVLRLKTWQNLAYAKHAKKLGLEVSDKEVSDELHRLLAAQGFTDPTPTLYRNWLKMSLQTHPAEFETMIREMLRIQKMVSDQSISKEEIPLVSEQEAKERFIKDQRMLSAEMLIFSTREEADSFKTQLKNNDWTEQATQSNFDIVKVEKAPLSMIERSWQIPANELLSIFQLNVGEISAPVLVQDHIALVRVIDKIEADLKIWSPEKTAEYQSKLSDDSKRLHLLKWHLELMQKAKIVDYSEQTQSLKTK